MSIGKKIAHKAQAAKGAAKKYFGRGWHGFGGEDRCDDYGAVPDSPERRCVGGFARRRGRGRPRCGVAVA